MTATVIIGLWTFGEVSVAAIGYWAGTAGFALGLALAGVSTADIAYADTSKADAQGTDRPSAEAGPARHSPTSRNRPTPDRAAGPTAKSRALTEAPAAPGTRRPQPPVVPTPAMAVAPAAPERGSVATPARAASPRPPVPAAVETAVRATAANPVPQAAGPAEAAATAPSITIHNTSTTQSIWVYNLTDTGNYSIPGTPWKPEPAPADWRGPVEIAAGSSAPVTLAVYNAPAGSPGNRIYIVESQPFTLPITPTSGVDPFYPPGSPGGDSFRNYSFLEYSLYPADGGYQYTIDVSYIDEWSLPIRTKFTLNGADWNGAVNGKTYGFNDFDTVVSQLRAAGAGYGNLVWSGATPWGPQPPATVSRIIGPDKVWTAQSTEPAPNFNMNKTGWVPASFQDFVQYAAHVDPKTKQTVYPYAFSGTGVSCPPASCTATSHTPTNFDFWRYQVTAPGSTPYPIALRTAAILDGFTTDNAKGVYGFFTYPNDEAAGQFTNIPTAVSLDVYVDGSSDGLSDSVIPGGVWNYTSSAARAGKRLRLLLNRPHQSGTDGTDTFIVDYPFRNAWTAAVLDVNGPGGDIAVIDRADLGATSTTIDVVNRARFLCGKLSNVDSQFVYEKSTGTLYYDKYPQIPGYTAVLAKFRGGVADPAGTLHVL